MRSVKNAIIGLLWPHSKNQYKPVLIRVQGLLTLAVAVTLISGLVNYSNTGKFQVLSFATDVNITDLLAETNQERVAAGLPGFSYSDRLGRAAQAKAQHMTANNYWAHIAPDGTTPWDFLADAGYVYIKAGENLAYGYLNSAATLDGWMNSPGHKANILESSFKEVGFGYADGPNFQGGENTVVVAMYGNPFQTVSDTQSPFTGNLTVPEEPIAPNTRGQGAQSEEIPSEVELVATSLQVTSDQSNAQIALADQENPVLSAQAKSRIITNLEAMVSGEASISMYLTISALMMVGAVYFLRHVRAVHRFIVAGEHLLEGHPLLEASIVYMAIWLVLSATYGVVI